MIKLHQVYGQKFKIGTQFDYHSYVTQLPKSYLVEIRSTEFLTYIFLKLSACSGDREIF